MDDWPEYRVDQDAIFWERVLGYYFDGVSMPVDIYESDEYQHVCCEDHAFGTIPHYGIMPIMCWRN